GGPDLRADRPAALTHRVAPSPACGGGSILLARHAVQDARTTGALRRAGRAGVGPAAASLPGTRAARAPIPTFPRSRGKGPTPQLRVARHEQPAPQTPSRHPARLVRRA